MKSRWHIIIKISTVLVIVAILQVNMTIFSRAYVISSQGSLTPKGRDRTSKTLAERPAYT